MSLLSLQTPPDCKIAWVASVNVARNLNIGIEMMHGEWVWMLKDAHVFAPDTLLRLLRHEVPVVGALCCHRRPPCLPIVYREQTVDGRYRSWPPAELPETGLVKVVGTAGAGLLVQKQVLDAVGQPWFTHSGGPGDDVSEDLSFQQRLRQAGYDIYVDVSTSIGHMGPGAVWPHWDADRGGWGAVIDMSCAIPQESQ